jgi:hypothetical protein
MFSLFLPNRIHIRRTYINSSGQSVVVPIIYTDINYGGCKTFAGSGSVIPGGQNGPTPRAIVCNGSATNLIVTEYTIVHELGHIFDNRSGTPPPGGGGNEGGIALRMGLRSFVRITDCTGIDTRVFGESPDQNQEIWTRGEAGCMNRWFSYFLHVIGNEEDCVNRTIFTFTVGILLIYTSNTPWALAKQRLPGLSDFNYPAPVWNHTRTC